MSTSNILHKSSGEISSRSINRPNIALHAEDVAVADLIDIHNHELRFIENVNKDDIGGGVPGDILTFFEDAAGITGTWGSYNIGVMNDKDEQGKWNTGVVSIHISATTAHGNIVGDDISKTYINYIDENTPNDIKNPIKIGRSYVPQGTTCNSWADILPIYISNGAGHTTITYSAENTLGHISKNVSAIGTITIDWVNMHVSGYIKNGDRIAVTNTSIEVTEDNEDISIGFTDVSGPSHDEISEGDEMQMTISISATTRKIISLPHMKDVSFIPSGVEYTITSVYNDIKTTDHVNASKTIHIRGSKHSSNGFIEKSTPGWDTQMQWSNSIPTPTNTWAPIFGAAGIYCGDVRHIAKTTIKYSGLRDASKPQFGGITDYNIQFYALALEEYKQDVDVYLDKDEKYFGGKYNDCESTWSMGNGGYSSYGADSYGDGAHQTIRDILVIYLCEMLAYHGISVRHIDQVWEAIIMTRSSLTG